MPLKPQLTQQTIVTPASISGVEFHTGEQSTITLQPAPVDTGILFRAGNSVAIASIENLISAHRSTTSLKVGSASISSIEHLLSALFGLGITNLYIDVITGTELPILDGSAQPWVELVLKAGIESQVAPTIPKKLLKTVEFKSGASEYLLTPSDNLEVTVEVDFPNTIIGKQNAHYIHNSQNYRDTIAKARTFIGDGANGMKLDREKILARLKSVDIAKPDSCACILYEQMRYITPLRFENEPASHKLLDFLGDFSLIGGVLRCKAIVKQPSHIVTQELVRKLRDEKLVI